MMGSVRLKPVFIVGLLLALVAFASEGARGEEELDQVSEVQCRPYIEKALKGLETGSHDENNDKDQGDDNESKETNEVVDEQVSSTAAESTPDGNEENEEENKEDDSSKQAEDEEENNNDNVTSDENKDKEVDSNQVSEEETQENKTDEVTEEVKISEEEQSKENTETDAEENATNEDENVSPEVKTEESIETQSNENNTEPSDDEEQVDDETQSDEKEKEETVEDSVEEIVEVSADDDSTKEDTSNEPEDIVSNDENDDSQVVDDASVEKIKSDEKSTETDAIDSTEKTNQSGGDNDNDNDNDDDSNKTIEDSGDEETKENNVESVENIVDDNETSKEKSVENIVDDEASKEKSVENVDGDETSKEKSGENNSETVSREKRSMNDESNQESEENANDVKESEEKDENATNEDENEASNETAESTPEEELIEEIEIPENLRPREHISQILRFDMDNQDREAAIERTAGIVLKDLKKLYDTAIQPLETLYKYRDLSNRHFGDPEIFSKPLILFMGPWSGGKSSIINYLLDIEYQPVALRTGGLQECIGESCKPPNATDAGAEPSPAYFNILMYGEEKEVLDGTQLAADWTFSGLQKFGQGMLDRLRGLKLKNKLLEKVNIVEIPGILEIRKQVQRLFPFNDACQWFIDRADIIFLVYDPSKLDVGPETEAILDQLKGREYQTRIILNKADQVKPEELMRVQGALIWNISPLMSSAEPPIMYSTSLWSLPYEAGAPTRLLYAQERAFLRDLRTAIDKRVEHKIASARRFAVRVRNHAKMVDCYLTTYYNHKTFFGSAKETSDKIIENPQEYHIYEGLSTLTNISRYDLPDPEVYRDFFRLNKLYDFPSLSSTCTYFRGCPINRLDVSIAYELPELVGKYKKSVEAAINENIDGKSPAS